MDKKRLDALGSMRFLFLLVIFFHHLNFLSIEPTHYFVKDIVTEARLGVVFFFMISGFLLSYGYEQKIVSNGLTLKEFYFGRITRILPLYWLTLLLAAPLTNFIHTNIGIIKTAIKFSANLTLTQSYVPLDTFYFSFNAVAWFASAIFFFYLLFPFIIRLIHSNKNSIYLFVGYVLVIFFLIQIIPEKYKEGIFYIHPLVRITDFIMGIFLYFALKNVTYKIPNIWASILEIASCALLAVFVLYKDLIPLVYRYSFYYWIPIIVIITNFYFQKGILSKILTYRLFIYLGNISVGFFLFHHIVIRYFKATNDSYFHFSNSELISVALLFVTIIISALSYTFFEQPIANYFNRLKIKVFKK